ncbi:unannotated protein [freshwater metagenome]|uniref:Unannotated protein n=1 Tax=freshwater metagenome TaxID=449393 RepID=A0A6J7QPN1_9ZZZZ
MVILAVLRVATPVQISVAILAVVLAATHVVIHVQILAVTLVQRLAAHLEAPILVVQAVARAVEHLHVGPVALSPVRHATDPGD